MKEGQIDWGFLGLKEPPFSTTPDPGYLYLTKAHEGALANLYYGIGERKGFMMITGEVGTGKTTLCRALLAQLDTTVHRALILSSNLERDELVRLIAADFGLQDQEGGKVESLEDLNRFLLAGLSRGENAVLVIDEAQNLPDATLEEIRLISNLETDREKLIQIILVGQPELREKLSRHHLRQLDQRICVRYHLRPLSPAETAEYIRHRIGSASSGEAPELFTPGALKAVHRWSQGFPRLVNIVCDRALKEAAGEGVRLAGASHVRRALKSIDDAPPVRRRYVRGGLAAVAAAAVLGVLVGRADFWKRTEAGGGIERPHRTRRAPPAVLDETAAAVSPGEPGSDTYGLVRVPSKGETLNASIATLFYLWGMEYLAGESGNWKIHNVSPNLLQVFFREMGISEQYGVAFYAQSPDGERVRKLGLPCFFRYREGEEGGHYAVLAALSGEMAVLFDPFLGRREIPLGVVMEAVEGPLFYLLKGRDLDYVLKEGERGSEVKALQEALQEAGFFEGPPDGSFGPGTRQAVLDLQKRHGIEADGAVGVETRLFLAKLSGEYAPTLDDSR